MVLVVVLLKACFLLLLHLLLLQILQIMHTVEESSETLSFATEPVIASLANVLAYQVSFLRVNENSVQILSEFMNNVTLNCNFSLKQLFPILCTKRIFLKKSKHHVIATLKQLDKETSNFVSIEDESNPQKERFLSYLFIGSRLGLNGQLFRRTFIPVGKMRKMWIE